MAKVKTTIPNRLQRIVAVVLIGGALLVLAGCGRGGSGAESSGGGGSGSAPTAAPTKRALPTMPAARFPAPTTMITPASAKPEVVATATLMPSEEMTGTQEMTGTEEISATEEITE